KHFAYMGFPDAWGDLVYNGAQKPAEADGLKILTNERYARTDTSVTGQVLKMMAAKPDAVLLGGAATQGALPPLALAERGYKGPLYGTPALLNTDFIRVGGKAVEGVQVSAGPVIVAEQLPDSHFSKKISMDFRAAYQKANGVPTSDGFSAYSFDAWLVFLDAAKRAMATGAKPGTPEFRLALRNAIFATKDLVGTHAIYNYKPSDSYGVDERALVMVRLGNGQGKYEPWADERRDRGDPGDGRHRQRGHLCPDRPRPGADLRRDARDLRAVRRHRCLHRAHSRLSGNRRPTGHGRPGGGARDPGDGGRGDRARQEPCISSTAARPAVLSCPAAGAR